ncbi:CMRF35-like molecule 8 isoform X2 [Electrophorus electricus]|uniref:CMRF35-like molecule 8 isoform X2 n=1 Tax=Electrophorus electricus TaxID=8005 RepID=UPI0015D06C38|nr:CMRF35-like molecule 8 isoform X2 [Electrophorus electricus]
MRMLLAELWTLTVLGSVTTDTLTVKGGVGGEVQIHCSHRLAGTNVKYFCTASCTEKDILIKSAKNKSVSGRFALFDEGSGVFTVTISNLRKSDSGTYWCGVERVFKDTYHEVILTISEASEPTPPSIVTSFRLPDHKTPEETEVREVTVSFKTRWHGTTMHTTSTTSMTRYINKERVYIGAGLAAVMLLLAIFLFMLVKQKNKHKKVTEHKIVKAHPFVNQPTSNSPIRNFNSFTTTNHQKDTTSTSNHMKAPCLQNTPTANNRSFPDVSSVEYSTIMSATDSRDSLNYVNVNFTRKADDLNYSSVIFIRGSDLNINNPTTSLEGSGLCDVVEPQEPIPAGHK